MIEEKIKEYWERNEHKMPYVKEYDNGAYYEVFNGSSIIIMNRAAYKKYGECLKNLAKEYLP